MFVFDLMYFFSILPVNETVSEHDLDDIYSAFTPYQYKTMMCFLMNFRRSYIKVQISKSIN
jgi:hypothetical protein